MTGVWRVEGPSQDPQPLGTATGLGHGEQAYEVSPGPGWVGGWAGGWLRTPYAGVMTATDTAEHAWSPGSWHEHPADQQPAWPDEDARKRVETQLSGLPPLVFAGEARNLTTALGEVAQGRAFLLQAGDSAESFDDFSADSIRDKLKVILQMAAVLTYAAGVPVVKVGRIAGQFAKPRSQPTEMVGETELEVFRGHMVNDDAFDPEARRPNPERLVTAYHQSASTLNLLRAFTTGGFADLTQVHAWNQEFVSTSAEGRRYERIAGEIDRALRFMSACGIDLAAEAGLHQVDFWTSHEALILPYEEALTRRDSLTGNWVDGSAHMLWVGERTRRLDGAHLRFLSGVINPRRRQDRPERHRRRGASGSARSSIPTASPVGSPSSPASVRTGSSTLLPPLIEAVAEPGHPVVWACDPMHGNTFTLGRPQDPALRGHLERAAGLFQGPPPGRDLAGWRPRRAHRRRRHRVPGRGRGDLRGRPAPALHDDV